MVLVSVVFCILLMLNVPLAFTIGISSILFFIGNPDLPLTIPVTNMISSTQSFPLLAVPFFVLAGNLMNACGITERLMKYASVLTGHLRGGLAQVNIVLSTLMGGISGSAASGRGHGSAHPGADHDKEGLLEGLHRRGHGNELPHNRDDPAGHRTDPLRLRRRSLHRKAFRRRHRPGAPYGGLPDVRRLDHLGKTQLCPGTRESGVAEGTRGQHKRKHLGPHLPGLADRGDPIRDFHPFRGRGLRRGLRLPRRQVRLQGIDLEEFSWKP